MDRIRELMEHEFHSVWVATNDVDAVTSIVSELKPGRNEVTRDEAERFSRELCLGSGSARVQRKRRQFARILWDAFHGPYDELPEWLR